MSKSSYNPIVLIWLKFHFYASFMFKSDGDSKKNEAIKKYGTELARNLPDISPTENALGLI